MKTSAKRLSCLLFFGCALGILAENVDLKRGVELIERGELADAGKVLQTIAASPFTSNLEKGIACKHLGTILFRQGSDAVAMFDRAEKYLSAELKKSSAANVREEYGKLCYQRANCRLTLLENEIANTRFNDGTTAFSLIRKYVFPLHKDIGTAKTCYPKDSTADLFLLEAEADIAEARIWLATDQAKSAGRLYGQALKKLDAAFATKEIKDDAKKKILLRKTAVIMESSPKPAESYPLIVPVLQEAIALKSGNVELDNAGVTLFAAYALRYSADPEKDFPGMKAALLASAESLEMLREKNLASADFNARKNYFASRTAAYEALLEYYAAKNDPASMLCVIESVKNRAIQDAMNIKERFSVKDLKIVQETLARKKAMLISYFFGNSNLWIISVTGKSISFRKLADSTGIARKITTVTKAFTQACRLLRGVPKVQKEFAVSLSNNLFAGLLHPEFQTFQTEKLEVLYFAPHSVLNYFPMGALVEKVDKEDYEKSIFFAERGIPMVNIPSLRLLDNQKKIARQGKFIFYRSDFSYERKKYHDNDNPPDLDGAKTEAHNIQKILEIPDSAIFAEKNATEENLLEKADRGAEIVHSATHGVLKSDQPLESFLFLAATPKEDGRLQVKELLGRYQGKLRCNLFVLSACNTNRGERNILPGDDVAALSSGILLAGADNVIATHWIASDDTFPKIMTDFYKNQERSSNPAKAMAAAIQTFLKNGEYRDPFFWACIVIQGRN